MWGLSSNNSASQFQGLFDFRVHAANPKELAEKTEWVFPKDKYVEWGQEDKSYCMMAEYGKWQKFQTAIIIGQDIIMHPDLLVELKKDPEGYNKVCSILKQKGSYP